VGKVQLHVAASSAPSWPAATAVCLHRPGDAASPISLEIQISAALLSALQMRPQEQPPSPLPPPSSSAPPPSGSLERLMDVGLEVKLRFGSRRMVLRDVLALSAGVVVEPTATCKLPSICCSTAASSRLAKWWWLDGKYGLRITEVLDPGSAA